MYFSSPFPTTTSISLRFWSLCSQMYLLLDIPDYYLGHCWETSLCVWARASISILSFMVILLFFDDVSSTDCSFSEGCPLQRVEFPLPLSLLREGSPFFTMSGHPWSQVVTKQWGVGDPVVSALLGQGWELQTPAHSEAIEGTVHWSDTRG